MICSGGNTKLEQDGDDERNLKMVGMISKGPLGRALTIKCLVDEISHTDGLVVVQESHRDLSAKKSSELNSGVVAVVNACAKARRTLKEVS